MKTTGWLLSGLGLMVLTGCGAPKFSIVLKEGEPVVPKVETQGMFGEWKAESFSPSEVERDSVAKQLQGVGNGRVVTYRTRRSAERGVYYRFYGARGAVNSEDEMVANDKEALLIYNVYALTITNISSAPITIESIEAETQEALLLPERGDLRTFGHSAIYSALFEGVRGFFWPLSPGVQLSVTTTIGEKGFPADMLKGSLPVEATFAPGETRTYYAVQGFVQSTEREDYQKAVEFCRKRVKSLVF